MVESTFLLQDKILIWYFGELFKMLWIKMWKIFNFFNHFFTLNSSYFTNRTTYAPLFFLPEILLLPFLVLKFEFFEHKKSNVCSTAIAMFWIGNSCYMSRTCVTLLVVWRGVLSRRTSCIWVGMNLDQNSVMFQFGRRSAEGSKTQNLPLFKPIDRKSKVV